MSSDEFIANFEAFQAQRKPLEQAANRRLVQSGLFLHVSGPKGGEPIQVDGALKNGTKFYFRERNGLVEVELNDRVVSKHRGQVNMSPDQAATYVLQFVRSR